MPHRDTSRTSLLSLSLLIFSAGMVSAAPLPSLVSLEKLDTQVAEASPTLILAQDSGSPPPAPDTRESTDTISLWLLGFIVLGLPFLLFWLRSLRGTKIVGKPSILILTPEPGESGRVYWEVSNQKIEALQRQGGKQMTLRLLDVTDINPQITDPTIVSQAKCSPLVNLLNIPIPQLDREYQAELGYLTTDEYWLPLVKSAPTYFAAPKALFGNLGSPSPTIVTAVGNLDITPPSIAPATSPVISPVISPAVSSVSPTPATPSPTKSPETSPETSLETPPVEITEEAKEADAPLAGDITSETLETSEISETSEVSIADPWATPDTLNTSEQPTIVTTTLPTPDPTPFPVPLESELDRADTITDSTDPEVTTTIPPVVPTIDDGESNLNWGVASALVPEVNPEVEPEVITEPEIVQLPSIETQINLTTPGAGEIYLTWEIDLIEIENCKARGGKDLGLRVYDATDIDISVAAPHSTHEYFCPEASGELVISALLGDRIYGDYIAELGYLTETREWIPVIRSLHIRVVR